MFIISNNSFFYSEKCLIPDLDCYCNTDHCNLTTIGGPWYFDRAVVPQRLINQSLYQEILLLQKFIDISGKVLKLKKIQPPTSEKKNEAVFYFFEVGG